MKADLTHDIWALVNISHAYDTDNNIKHWNESYINIATMRSVKHQANKGNFSKLGQVCSREEIGTVLTPNSKVMSLYSGSHIMPQWATVGESVYAEQGGGIVGKILYMDNIITVVCFTDTLDIVDESMLSIVRNGMYYYLRVNGGY